MSLLTRDEPTTVETARPGRRPLVVVSGLALPVLFGVLLALLMPRGPVTPGDVIVSMLVGVGVGLGTGWLVGRWAMLGSPVLFALCFELGRIGFDAPSLDGIHLGSSLGLVLFLTGRAFHGLVVLVPMIWAAAIGSAAARRARTDGNGGKRWPWISTALLAMVVVAAGLVVSRPGRTDPILTDGAPLAGSVAEIVSVDLGGHDQSVIIRGNDITNPVLLYLTGGPGNSDLGYSRTFLEEVEEDFVLVTWDQRGIGKSYAALDPVSTLTVDSAVTDVIELSEFLADRFDDQSIYLFGNSWGSIIGVLAAEQRPDLYRAYIGAGQMVNPLETDLRLYDQMLEYAADIGDEELLQLMEGFGRPPYADLYGYMTVLEHYGDLEPYTETAEFAAGVPGIQGIGVSEYGFMDKLNVFRGLADMGGHLYPQAQDIDFRRDVPELEVPVYLIQGGHELSARATLAEEYASMLEAPSLDVVVFENSGHVPHFEEAGRFHRYLVDVVLAETEGAQS
ncbi:MAG TPA: alpha/beta hydrolase [Acidimicrobiia bacterium]|nr:alpha/beta hydrolase [Acidimicrobiia bacterium]